MIILLEKRVRPPSGEGEIRVHLGMKDQICLDTGKLQMRDLL